MKDKLHQVTAPITGTIWKIVTEVGAAVTEADTLIIMESMKMEMPIEAGYDGVVLEIHIKEGQPVNEGALVATLKRA